MKVIEINVITGEVTERAYTQKEIDAVAVMDVESKANKKRQGVAQKRKEAIEELLMTSIDTKAVAYQNAKAGL